MVYILTLVIALL